VEIKVTTFTCEEYGEKRDCRVKTGITTSEGKKECSFGEG
jgi:hypothetical protein